MRRIQLLIIVIIISYTGLSGQTLKDAIDKKDTVQAALLIKNGANVNELDANGASFLITSCRWGDETMINFLLRHGANPNNPKTQTGRTPLIVGCAYYAKKDAIKMLLDKGADANAATNDGVTALMIAAEYQKADIVELLLKKGAKANLKDKKGRNAIDYLNMNAVDDDLKKMLTGFIIDKEAVRNMLANAIK